MTDLDLTAIRARYEAADQTLHELCSGKQRWRMCIPAQPDDPDLVFSAALADIPALLAEHELLDALAAYAKHDLDCAVTESRGRCSCGFQATYDALSASAADREAS